MTRPLPSRALYLALVYGNIVLYAICYMAQVPVLPYLVKQLGASSSSYGTLQTIFSAVQFIGGLVSGPLVDRYGGRALLLVSFAASIVSYVFTAAATNIWMLYLSRLPTILQHAMLAARTLVTDLSDPQDRARYLGYVGVSYGVGFAVGPVVGGWIGNSNPQVTAWYATAGSIVSLILVAALLPKGSPGRKAVGTAASGNSSGNSISISSTLASEGAGKPPAAPAASDSGGTPDGAVSNGAFPVQPSKGQGQEKLYTRFVEVCRQPGVLHMLVSKALVGFGFALFQSMFPVMLQEQYGLGAQGNGAMLSYVGLLFVAVQALCVGPATRKFGESRVEAGCSWLLAASFLGLAAARQLWHVLLLMVPLSLGGLLFNTANTARLTKAVSPSLSGTVLALDMSLGSGLRMLSPAAGSAIVAAAKRSGHTVGAAVGSSAASLVVLLLGLSWLGIVELGGSARSVSEQPEPGSRHEQEVERKKEQ